MISSNHAIFLINQDSKYSYNQLFRFSESFYDSYTKTVGEISDRPLLILCDLSVHSVFIIISCFLKGIPFVPIAWDTSTTRIEKIINDLNPVACVQTCGTPYSSDSLHTVSIPKIGANQNHSFFDPFLEFSAERIMAYVYTSGSTSTPKAVPIKYGQIRAALTASSANLSLIPGDEWLLNLPLHHIGGMSVLLRSLHARSSVYILNSTSTADLSAVLTHRSTLTHVSLVPTQLKRVLDLPTFHIQPNIKALLLGGGPISKSLHEKALALRIPVIPSFGMTESAAQCIAVPYSERFTAPHGTCGKPLLNVQIELRPESPELQSEHKLLWIKGPQIISSYADTTNNVDAFDDSGWFNSGDFAHVDDQGFVFIEMRRTDRIISGGENINPAEVEEYLEQLPGILEAGVLGIPNEEWGQLVCALVIPRDRNIKVDVSEAATRLKAVLPSFKIPKRLICVESLPRTASGKLMRSKLYELVPDYPDSPTRANNTST
jgi:o-succinylbenzoate---CoA ligase